jgi:tripartite-type tricarboxylate transporter receptor subunit TctC
MSVKTLALLLALTTPSAVHAQTYPAKPVRIIVPLAAGGLADMLARVVAQRVGEVSGQNAVVQNRPGGAGAIGMEAAVRSPPDGYRLFLGGQGTNATLPHLTKLPFDPGKDLTAIIQIAVFPNLLVVHPSLPVRTVKELVDYAKANPGTISYASQGNGSSGHLVGEQFKQVAGIEMVHVPYRGAAPAVQDLVAGHVQVMFDSVAMQMPQINAGATRALAVLSPQRAGSLPNVPTMSEAGFAEMQTGTWFGLFAPAGTPRAAIDWINSETRKALATGDVRERLLAQGALLPLGAPEEFAAFVAADRERWGEVIRKANIRLE